VDIHGFVHIESTPRGTWWMTTDVTSAFVDRLASSGSQYQVSNR